MGTLILCSGNEAAEPYHLEESGMEIYSLEELSCYIMQNAMLLDSSFMRTSLCDWIREELDMPSLADRLRELIAEKASISDFIKPLLEATDYCSREEQRKLIHAVMSMEKKTEYERRKLKADLFCRKGKYISAIREYRLITTREFAARPDALFMGSIWHNMGTAYARMFLFEEARAAYEKAYSCNEKVDSLRMMLFACLCSRKEQTFRELCEKYYIDERSREKLIVEFKRSGENYDHHPLFDALNEIIDTQGDEKLRRDKEEEFLLGVKADYRKISRL